MVEINLQQEYTYESNFILPLQCSNFSEFPDMSFHKFICLLMLNLPFSFINSKTGIAYHILSSLVRLLGSELQFWNNLGLRGRTNHIYKTNEEKYVLLKQTNFRP